MDVAVIWTNYREPFASILPYPILSYLLSSASPALCVSSSVSATGIDTVEDARESNDLIIQCCLAFFAYLLLGYVFFNFTEGWGLLDCVYFSVAMMLTLGISDLTPSTENSRAFTAFFALAGFAVASALIGTLAHKWFHRQASCIYAAKSEHAADRRMLSCACISTDLPIEALKGHHKLLPSRQR